MRRLRSALLLSLALVAAAAAPARAHTHLVSATPAPHARLSALPADLRLLFTEEIELPLCAVHILDASGAATQLVVRADPSSDRVLLARLPALAPGEYTVRWRAVSADGHAVHGAYSFTLLAGAGAAGPPAGAQAPASDTGAPGRSHAAMSAREMAGQAGEHEVAASAPPGAALLRGLAALALLLAAGVLALGRWAATPAAAGPLRRLGIGLALAAAVLVLADAAAWAWYAGGALDGNTLRALLGTLPGRAVALRAALVLLALLAVLAGRVRVAAALALAALVVGGVVGHAAAVHPAIAIPLKVLHLLSVALWLGGVALLLFLLGRRDAGAAAVERVSALALWTALLTGLSGLALVLLFLDAPGELVRTPYGRLVLAKAAGMVVLLAFGAAHRLSLIGRLHAGRQTGMLRALRAEILVFAAVVLVAGFLAYTPLPGEGHDQPASARVSPAGR